MQIRKNADLPTFLQQVRLCQGDVWFITEGGDQLNLKSILSEFLFLSAAISSQLVEKGHVQFQNSEDIQQLSAYLQEG